MTVKELIKQLQAFPQDAEIAVDEEMDTSSLSGNSIWRLKTASKKTKPAVPGSSSVDWGYRIATNFIHQGDFFGYSDKLLDRLSNLCGLRASS